MTTSFVKKIEKKRTNEQAWILASAKSQEKTRHKQKKWAFFRQRWKWHDNLCKYGLKCFFLLSRKLLCASEGGFFNSMETCKLQTTSRGEKRRRRRKNKNTMISLEKKHFFVWLKPTEQRSPLKNCGCLFSSICFELRKSKTSIRIQTSTCMFGWILCKLYLCLD